MPRYTLTVNGTRHTVDVDADTPLLWVLRDELGYTGTKYSCGIGMCGSCSAIVNGALERTCVLPISSVDGAEVMTIEGLTADRSHPLQRAWIEDQVPQCGYCQSGQLLGAMVLLQNNPDPTDEEIDEAMSDFLCRCGTYQRIREAIHRAAKEMNDVTRR
jgi:aerobic-type carbon monoxide dehydrogenase small subunit (CoxS/CutS family)